MKTVPDAELPKRRSVGGVFLGGLLGLGIAILLNSATLLADAEKLPDGASRSVSLAFWKPIEASASALGLTCLLYTSPSPRDKRQSRMPSSA